MLAEILADPSVTTSQDVVAAFKGYDAIRRPRSQKVVSTSKENAKLLCLCYPGVEDDGEKLKAIWTDRFRWLWDIDLHAQVEDARQVMLDTL